MTQLYNFLRKQILPIDKIDKALPTRGVILDLGCGQGLIATYIAAKKYRTVIGIDANNKRLPNSNLENLTFKNGDITKLSVSKIDGVVISDVLHHIPKIKQDALFKKIFNNLNKNGRLVIKEIDSGELIRSNLSRLWDFLLYPKDKIAYRRSSELKVFLKKIGFTVSVSRPCRLFPGSTTLYICSKT